MALEYIIDLVTTYPFLRDLFDDRDLGVHDRLESVRDSDPEKISYEIRERHVLASRALLCFEVNEITDMAMTAQNSQQQTPTDKIMEDKRNAIIGLLTFKKSR